MKFRTLAAISLSVVLLVSFMPYAHAASIWAGTSCVGPSGGPINPCTFCDGLIVGKNIINFLEEIAISITVLMIVWGAMRLVIAAGDPGRITDARETMKRGIIGLTIVLSSWVLMNALLIFIARGTSSGDTANWKWNEIQCTQ